MHAHKGIFREDALAMGEVNGWQLVVVADGGGTTTETLPGGGATYPFRPHRTPVGVSARSATSVTVVDHITIDCPLRLQATPRL